jgi:succinoglycan biosynthesis protein ExoM
MRRPTSLVRLLEALGSQQSDNEFTFSVVVVDNDAGESARQTVEKFGSTSRFRINYHVEPRQSIPLARNRALAAAEGDYIAFIDDDEFPGSDWLQTLFRTCQSYRVDGVLGPVRPHFEVPPPRWVVRGRFCHRPEHETGRVMHWDECRTGNVLFRRDLVRLLDVPFNPKFGSGEDKDFFMRLTAQSRVFIWCNEAPVFETVPPSRCTRGYMLRRALWRGNNIVKRRVGRINLFARSVVAVPLYALALPALVIFGHHLFMRYCIKLCDHLGRMLALIGLNPIREHQF